MNLFFNGLNKAYVKCPFRVKRRIAGSAFFILSYFAVIYPKIRFFFFFLKIIHTQFQHFFLPPTDIKF